MIIIKVYGKLSLFFFSIKGTDHSEYLILPADEQNFS